MSKRRNVVAYNKAKELARELGIPVNLPWPRVGTDLANQRVQELELIKREKELEQEQNEQEQNVIIDEQEPEDLDYINKIIEELANYEQNKINKVDNINIDKMGGIKNLFQIINNIVTRKMVIKYGDNYYALNINTQNKITKILDNQGIDVQQTESDKEFIRVLNNSCTISIEAPAKIKGNKVRDGAFFPFTHKLKFNFSKYGIFKKVQSKNYKNNCFYNAMKEAGLPKGKLNELKSLISSITVPMSKIKNVCKKLGIKLKISQISVDKNSHTIRCGTEGHEYEIGLISSGINHYFVKDKVDITTFAINNYNKVKKLKNWNKIVSIGKRVERKKKFINSCHLFKLLLLNKEQLLEPIKRSDELYKTNVYNKTINDDLGLTNNKKNYKKFETNLDTEPLEDNDVISIKVGNDFEDFDIIFFDVETYLNKDNIHEVYTCSYYNSTQKIMKSFFGPDCCKQLLNSLPTYSLLYAHNCGYDFRFIFQDIFIKDYINKGRSLITAHGCYKGKVIYFRDSCKLIPERLSRFGSMFQLEQAKEVMPYDLYNVPGIMDKKIVDIEYACGFLETDEEKIQFRDNIKKWNLNIGNRFNIVKYSSKYCEMDCKVLYDGFMTFKKQIHEVTGLNICNYFSLPSVADKYLKNQGCYDGTYSISGVTRAFIQKCIVGGRCMMANNSKQMQKNCNIADFDACSLYPSAMKRLKDEFGGLLMGTPKLINKHQKNYYFLKEKDGYFIKIKIDHVGKKRDFPLLSFVENGIRNFSNDLVGKEIYVDKIALEDAIKFQDISFDIIKGYYYDQGRNPKIGEIMSYLYETRKIKKKEKNPIQVIYKLLMNSAYGKSILKPISNNSKIVNSKEEFDEYFSRHYNNIEEGFKICDNKYFIKVNKGINDHFNFAHVGCEILSMSKRIMNEVMCLAEDNNLKIYYQDTDSMHIDYDDVNTLGDLFKQKYNKELIGTNMGQFHVDFDLKGANPDTLRSINFISVGKKCYIDQLQGQDYNGNTVSGYHLRMKGIPNQSILYTCQKLNLSPLELYKKLYKGEKITFDLLCDGNKKIFKYNKNMTVTFETNFKRQLIF